jgi:nitrite reductase/ring-hydroxylating ferredoxin subunit
MTPTGGADPVTTNEPEFTPIASADEVEVGCALQVCIDGREPLAVVRLEDGFYVMDDTCTHGAASMSEGDVVGFEIECPFHSGRFDVRTGAVTGLPCTKALTVYPVKVEGGRVCAALGSGRCVDEQTAA